ncbi:MAG: DUF7544 domain-containing protein [Planctomycetota bacterium]|jgi:hypothetical protein
MDTTQPREISVIEPIGAAIEKTKQILFQPFDMIKWFAIGFCAWLATLGNGGGGGGFNFGGPGNHSGGGTPNFHQEMNNAKNAILENLPVVISVAAVVIVLVLALTLVLMWLKSRGQFMFLHCVAENKGEVVKPWKQYAQQANSLFLFKIVLWLAGSVASLFFIVPLIFIVIAFAKTDFKVFVAAQIIPTVFLVLGFIVLAILLTAVKTLTEDFVVPIMRLEACTVTDGWKRFWALCKPNFGTFFLFLLFLVVVSIVLGMIAFAVVVGACCLCCVGIIFMLPYIGTVAMLPLLVWRRAYSALFLAQFGPEFDVFASEAVPVVVPTASIPPIPPEQDNLPTDPAF